MMTLTDSRNRGISLEKGSELFLYKCDISILIAPYIS